ncbi:DUF6466 family protein [Bifidobacterium phasiani]|uniref:DUF6466 family protein n=1 Tax=Bifidobacterium phasiani TaxID=2834431 RepID=UPI001F277248|nr:DUF6466 family protein [Bifidobacterium phasiani]
MSANASRTRAREARPGAAARTARTARAPLAVRIALAVAAALLLAAAAVAAVNLYAVYTFNQATASLNANIAAASDDATDLQMLQIRQQQTDAQFEDAGAFGFLLLPQVRSDIEHNAAASSLLTERTIQEVELQHDGGDSADAAAVGVEDAGRGDDAKQGGGLTEEQRRQVEELLQANQPATSDQSATDDGQSADNGDGDEQTSTTKPW